MTTRPGRPAAAETDPVEPHEEAQGAGRVTGDVHRPVRVGDVVGQPVVRDARDPVVQRGRQVGRAAGGAEVLVLGVQDLRDPVLAVDEREAEHPRQPTGVRREQQTGPGQPRRERDRPPDREHADQHRGNGARPQPRIPDRVQRREVAHVHVPASDGRQRHRDRRQDQSEGQAHERRDAGSPRPGLSPWCPRVGTGISADRGSGGDGCKRQPLLRIRQPRNGLRRTYVEKVSDQRAVCDVVIPCRDEAPALPALLAKLPPGFRALVVDNGSRDNTAEVATGCGATVVDEPRPGYGAAVHAGLRGRHGRLRRGDGR